MFMQKYNSLKLSLPTYIEFIECIIKIVHTLLKY